MLLIIRIISFFCISLFSSLLSLTYAIQIDRTPVANETDVGDAINTQSAGVLDVKTWWFSFRDNYYHFQPFNSSQLVDYAAQTGRDIETEEAYSYLTLSVAYGLTDKITVGAALPYYQLTNIRTTDISNGFPTQILDLGNSQGLSDLTLFLEYLLWNDKDRNLTASMTFGASLPTGAAYLRDSQGALFPPDDQPGSGTVLPYIGIAMTKTLEKSSVSANLFYTQGHKGAQNANLGNWLEYNLAYVRQIYKGKTKYALQGVVELNGGYYTPARVDGETSPDSGSSIVRITTGLRLITPKNISPFIASYIPIIKSYRGIQPKENYGIVGGIDFSI